MPHAYTKDQLVEQPAIGLFAELRGLPIRERLEHIAWDDTRSLSCYPSDLAACPAEDVKQLDPVTRNRLVAKLRERKKGPWHKLAKELGFALTQKSSATTDCCRGRSFYEQPPQ